MAWGNREKRGLKKMRKRLLLFGGQKGSYSLRGVQKEAEATGSKRSGK